MKFNVKYLPHFVLAILCLACGGSSSDSPNFKLYLVGDNVLEPGESTRVRLEWSFQALGESRFTPSSQDVFETIPAYSRTTQSGSYEFDLTIKANAPVGVHSIQTNGTLEVLTIEVVDSNAFPTEARLTATSSGLPASGTGSIALHLRASATSNQSWEVFANSPLTLTDANPRTIVTGGDTFDIGFLINGITLQEITALRAAGAISAKYTVFCNPIGSQIFRTYSGELRQGGMLAGTMTVTLKRDELTSGMNFYANRVVLEVELSLPGRAVNDEFPQVTLPLSFSGGGESYSVFISDYQAAQLTGTLRIGVSDPLDVFDFILVSP